MYVFARSRTRAAAPLIPTPSTHHGFDRVEFLCFLFRLTILLGVATLAIQSHVVH